MKRLESIIKIHTLSKDQICSLINKTAVTFIDSILLHFGAISGSFS